MFPPFESEHEHTTDSPNEGRGRRGGRRRPGGRGPGGRGPGGPGPGGRGGRGRGRGPEGHGPGRQRARRGAVAQGVLLVLADESPLHGYDLISKLEQRSEGRWRPSPGSMYPSLARLEDKGLIVGAEGEDGKRLYELTESGRDRIEKLDPDAPLPWDEESAGPANDLRPLIAEIVSQTRQVGRFGSAAQRDQAVAVLKDTKAKLYTILANADTAGDADTASQS